MYEILLYLMLLSSQYWPLALVILTGCYYLYCLWTSSFHFDHTLILSELQNSWIQFYTVLYNYIIGVSRMIYGEVEGSMIQVWLPSNMCSSLDLSTHIGWRKKKGKKCGLARKPVPGRARAILFLARFSSGLFSPARCSPKPEWAGPKQAGPPVLTALLLVYDNWGL